MKKFVLAILFATFAAAIPACVSHQPVEPSGPLSTSTVPVPGTKCGYQVERWVCSYATPGSKPAGYYTPSKVIPAGKTIYRGCKTECVMGYNPVTQTCIGYGVTWEQRPNHSNDIVLSGGRRAWCGTTSNHVSEYFTLP